MRNDPLNDLLFIVFFLVIVVGPVPLSAWNFHRKGYSPLWGLLAILGLVGWIVLLISFLVKPRPQCSKCGGYIERNFKLCPYCMTPVPSNDSPTVWRADENAAPPGVL